MATLTPRAIAAMISNLTVSLREFLQSVYIPDRVDLSPDSADQLRIAVNLLDRWAGKSVTFEDLKFDSSEKRRSPKFRSQRVLTRWMQWLRSSASPHSGKPRSPRTVNNKVDSILTIWRYAFDQGYCDHFPRKIQKLKLPKQIPLSPLLLKVMQKWNGRPNGRYTFSRNGAPLSVNKASDHFNRSLANSKWSKIRGWHVFRQSFISNCAAAGIDQRIIDA